MQLWTAGSMVFSDATGDATMTQFWSQQLANANAETAAQRQLGAEGLSAWEDARKDPLLGQALSIED
jgi:hypothetical protein